jgi:hypothetical protein
MLFFACSSDEKEESIQSDFKTYIIGYVEDPILTDKATLWKNGTQVNLSNGNIAGRSRGTDLFVNNNDVYVTINELESKVANILKNGANIFETDPILQASFNSVFVSGNDVYACGSIAQNGIAVAAVWKNGILTKLEDVLSNALSVFVDNDKIYVSGQIWDENASISRATYWKNGIVTVLNTNDYRTNAKKITISNGDVHIIGEGYDTTSLAKYWKNGVETNLNTNAFSASAENIYVDGTDVYVVGSDNQYPVIWKNSIVSNLNNSIEEGQALSVLISNNNIYTMGIIIEQGTNDTKIKVWKNEQEFQSIRIYNVNSIEAIVMVE